MPSSARPSSEPQLLGLRPGEQDNDDRLFEALPFPREQPSRDASVSYREALFPLWWLLGDCPLAISCATGAAFAPSNRNSCGSSISSSGGSGGDSSVSKVPPLDSGNIAFRNSLKTVSEHHAMPPRLCRLPDQLFVEALKRDEPITLCDGLCCAEHSSS